MLAIQGTDIASALQLSMGLFSQSKETSKSIIVITDGENHDGDAVAMAKKVAENGITVNVMGVGTAQGAPIPIAGTSNFRRDKDGNVVVTKLNEQMCQEVASAGNGLYVHVDNSVTAVNQLKEELNKLEKTEMEQMVYTEYNEQYDVIGWIVFVLLLLEVLLLERKNPLFKKIKLF
jgi:Ca-activated chloride channel family protein